MSNRFFELIIGPTMTYSCGVFDTERTTLDEAQVEKVDLICRKLDLRPGQRLLDVGAGWGAYVLSKPALNAEIQREIDGLIASGHVRPIVGARLPLERAAEALELIDVRRAVGKVVLDVR